MLFLGMLEGDSRWYVVAGFIGGLWVGCMAFLFLPQHGGLRDGSFEKGPENFS